MNKTLGHNYTASRNRLPFIIERIGLIEVNLIPSALNLFGLFGDLY